MSSWPLLIFLFILFSLLSVKLHCLLITVCSNCNFTSFTDYVRTAVMICWVVSVYSVSKLWSLLNTALLMVITQRLWVSVIQVNEAAQIFIGQAFWLSESIYRVFQQKLHKVYTLQFCSRKLTSQTYVVFSNMFSKKLFTWQMSVYKYDN